jgi:PhoH-like ATPase
LYEEKMSRKIFVVDTSVMLYDKLAIHQFSGNDVVLPLCILEELDKFKEKRGLLGESARYVNRYLDALRDSEKDEDGWSIEKEQDIRYKFVTKSVKSYIPEGLDTSYTDNHIIACAKYLKEAHPETVVLVITKDINLRVKCDAVGVVAEDYYKDHIESDVKSLRGYREIEVSPEIINDFYSSDNPKIPWPSDDKCEENCFIVAKSSAGNGQSFLGIKKKNSIQKLKHEMNGFITVEPRNSEQRFAIEALLDPDIPLVTLTGLAGSGKTFLALMAGLYRLQKGNPHHGGIKIPEEFSHLANGYERLVITRTLQPVGRDLGFLPGSMEDKMQPWLMPILDNVRHAFKDISYFKMMIEQGEIEVAPIPYIRGRTFNNSLVLVDEAQNATIHELKTIVTRIGTGSKIVLLGDVDQIDTPYIDRQSSGLSIVIDKFRNSKLAAHVNLSKGQRSDLASAAGMIL